MSFSFPKSARLLTRRSFLLVRNGKRLSGKCFNLSIRKNFTELTRIGITVSKKFGKSHDRNLFKRLVREAFRLSLDSLPSGLDIVVFPSKSGSKATLSDLRHDFATLFPC